MLMGPGSDGIIHSALASRQMSRLIHGLRSETKSSIIQMMARIPVGYEVSVQYSVEYRYQVFTNHNQIIIEMEECLNPYIYGEGHTRGECG